MSFSVSHLGYSSVHRQPPTLYYPPTLHNKPVINSLLFLPWPLPQLAGPCDQVYATWTYDQATSLSPTCTYWWWYCLTSRRGNHRRCMFALANKLQTLSKKIPGALCGSQCRLIVGMFPWLAEYLDFLLHGRGGIIAQFILPLPFGFQHTVLSPEV